MLNYYHEKNKTKKILLCKYRVYTRSVELQGLETVKTRRIIVRNDGKTNRSDAGLLLLQQVEQKHRIIEKLSRCFTDKRMSGVITIPHDKPARVIKIPHTIQLRAFKIPHKSVSRVITIPHSLYNTPATKRGSTYGIQKMNIIDLKCIYRRLQSDQSITQVHQNTP